MGQETSDKYSRRFKNCEQNFKEKLFLTSFDLMTLNISSRLLFQAYLFFDFIFIVYYPLMSIFKYSKSALASSRKDNLYVFISNIVQYLNPADKLFDSISYSLNEQAEVFLIVYSIFAFTILISLILTRNKKKLVISSQRKFLNKLIGLIITMTNFFLFVPVLSYTS